MICLKLWGEGGILLNLFSNTHEKTNLFEGGPCDGMWK